jgi:membrane fusion protein, copper/silver efflux system
MKRAVFRVAFYASLLVAVAAAGLWLWQTQHAPSARASACPTGTPAYWYDPMFPTQHFDQPGKSPFMDMQLVPKCTDAARVAGAGADSAPTGSIAVDPRIVQSLGVRLAAAELGSLARVVDTVGVVAVDEHGIQVVQVRAPGWVEELDVRAAGDPVRRGQRLAAVYAPDLLSAQQEFLIALSARDDALVGAARQRLALLGLSAGQVARIEGSRQAEPRVSYYAAFDGYVMELGVRQGAAVERDTTLFQLADPGTVWVNAEVPESQAAWIKAGDRAEAEVAALPGEHFEGTIDYAYPELMPGTRTLKLRVVLSNTELDLRPGMFASMRLYGTPKSRALLIPTEAVIETGVRSVVIVADDANHFHPAFVQVGAEYAGQSEILDGLTPGQQVVASGQFLIDSEAGLRGAFNRLTGPAGDTVQDPGTTGAPK